MKVFRGSRLKLFVYALVGLLVLRFTGLYMYFCQENYFSELTYRSPQITDSIDQLLANREPQVTPTYTYEHGYRLLSLGRCSNETGRVDVLFLVKSAVVNYDNRMAIRRTWGLEKRFHSLGYTIQVLFLLALPPPDQEVYSQQAVEAEHRSFDDLVQGNFIDRYYNNTLKTVMGFGWAKDHCPQADFIMFVDDDFYVSTKNVLRLIANPHHYPPEVDAGDDPATAILNQLEPNRRDVSQMTGQHWYTGHLFFILPVRFYFHKFFMSLDEYPYNVFPPFINAGAYLITRRTLLAFYYAVMYTRPIKLDDVYVGILARKVNVTATHNRYFFPHRVPSSRAFYQHLIATHGFRNSQDLLKVWNQQFEFGNA